MRTHTHRHTLIFIYIDRYKKKRHLGPLGPFGDRCKFQKPFHLIKFPHRYIPQDREKLNGGKYIKHTRRKDIGGPRPRNNGHLKLCAL